MDYHYDMGKGTCVNRYQSLGEEPRHGWRGEWRFTRFFFKAVGLAIAASVLGLTPWITAQETVVLPAEPVLSSEPATEEEPLVLSEQDARLVEAVMAGDAAGIQAALLEGARVDTPLATGDRPLQHVVREGRPDLAVLLMAWCADPTILGRDGLNALSIAILQRDEVTSRVLLENGADPNAPNSSPLPDWAREQYEQKWFVQQSRYDVGLTPLMLAVVMGDEALVKTMMAYGAKVWQRSKKYGMDAVTFSCRAQYPRITQILLKREPDNGETRRIVVSLSQQRATFYKGNEVVATSQVSTGRKTHRTPTGTFIITSKHKNWVSTIYKVPMPYLLRLNASDIGFHQGALPGYPASHGCIRLPASKAAQFFKIAQVGDWVEIRN